MSDIDNAQLASGLSEIQIKLHEASRELLLEGLPCSRAESIAFINRAADPDKILKYWCGQAVTCFNDKDFIFRGACIAYFIKNIFVAAGKQCANLTLTQTKVYIAKIAIPTANFLTHYPEIKFDAAFDKILLKSS